MEKIYVLRYKNNPKIFYGGVKGAVNINNAIKWKESSNKPGNGIVRTSSYDWYMISDDGTLVKTEPIEI
jgi:hypothetical protein